MDNHFQSCVLDLDVKKVFLIWFDYEMAPELNNKYNLLSVTDISQNIFVFKKNDNIL